MHYALYVNDVCAFKCCLNQAFVALKWEPRAHHTNSRTCRSAQPSEDIPSLTRCQASHPGGCCRQQHVLHSIYTDSHMFHMYRV